MRLRRDQLVTRTCGTLVGIGFLLLGVFSLSGGADLTVDADKDRAFWFGVTLITAGVLAVVVSLTATNLNDIWCRHPRRWWTP